MNITHTYVWHAPSSYLRNARCLIRTFLLCIKHLKIGALRLHAALSNILKYQAKPPNSSVHAPPPPKGGVYTGYTETLHRHALTLRCRSGWMRACRVTLT